MTRCKQSTLSACTGLLPPEVWPLLPLLPLKELKLLRPFLHCMHCGYASAWLLTDRRCCNMQETHALWPQSLSSTTGRVEPPHFPHTTATAGAPPDARPWLAAGDGAVGSGVAATAAAELDAEILDGGCPLSP